MPFEARLPGFNIILIDTNPTPEEPSISDGIQQTLTRLIAYDPVARGFRPMQSDVNNRLIVATFPQFEFNQRATDNAFPVANGATATLKAAPTLNHWIIGGLSFNTDIAGRYIIRISGVQLADFNAIATGTYNLPIPSNGIHVIPQAIGLQVQNLSGAAANVGFTMLYTEVAAYPIVIPT